MTDLGSKISRLARSFARFHAERSRRLSVDVTVVAPGAIDKMLTDDQRRILRERD